MLFIFMTSSISVVIQVVGAGALPEDQFHLVSGECFGDPSNLGDG